MDQRNTSPRDTVLVPIALGPPALSPPIECGKACVVSDMKVQSSTCERPDTERLLLDCRRD